MKIYQPGEKIPESEMFAYITARGGHYLMKRNGFFDACVKVDELPGHEEQEEFFHLRTGKLPLALLWQALAFMEKVHEKHASEALVLLTYEEEWGLYVPKQEVSAASVEYENDENERVVGSIHSHPGFRAAPSSIDVHDELNFDGVHIISSGFVPVAACISAFAVVNGRRFELDPAELIEELQVPDVEVPAAWMKKVTKQYSLSRCPSDEEIDDFWSSWGRF